MTVSGLPGKSGVPAQSPVPVGFRSEYENALILHLLMAAENALEERNRHNLAICRPVRVNKQIKRDTTNGKRQNDHATTIILPLPLAVFLF